MKSLEYLNGHCDYEMVLLEETSDNGKAMEKLLFLLKNSSCGSRSNYRLCTSWKLPYIRTGLAPKQTHTALL